MTSHEIAAADSLLTENAELRAALAVAMAENDRWREIATIAGRVVEASRCYNDRPYGVENGLLRINVTETIYAYDQALKVGGK